MDEKNPNIVLIVPGQVISEFGVIHVMHILSTRKRMATKVPTIVHSQCNRILSASSFYFNLFGTIKSTFKSESRNRSQKLEY